MAYRHHYNTSIWSLALADRRCLGFVLCLAIPLLALITSPVEARAQARASECNVTMPCDFSYDASRRHAARPTRRVRVVEQVRQHVVIARHSAPQYMVQRPMMRRHVEKVVEQRPQIAGQDHTGARAAFQSPEASNTLGRPGRYIAGRLICAVNVGSALAERGIKGTGSALAMSYLKWGRSAGGPVPGAVIVSARRGGGHVAIVSRVVNGIVYAWNATGGKSGWREIPYRHSVIDYRVPG